MKHTEIYPIRWHETDANRNLRPTALLALMQETANLQCEKNGAPLERLRDERGVGFILSRLAMKIYRPLHAYEEIRSQTWVSEGHGFAFNRFFQVWQGEELIAEAATVWALLNLKTRTFERNEDFQFPFEGEPAPSTKLPLRLRIPPECELTPVGERKIVYSDIDYNMHMNNTKYPDMLCDFIDGIEHFEITDLTLSYLHESAFGDTLKIYRGRIDNTYYFRTYNASDTLCMEAAITVKPI